MAAEKSLHRTVVKIENTAHKHVIWKEGITMINKTYSVNIGEYQLAMATAYKLLKLSIISLKDLAFIEEKTAKKYGIKKHSLYRIYHLL